MKNHEQNIKPVVAKHFLIYWRVENVVAHIESGYPLDVLASNQLKRVSSGDTLWLVTIIESGELVLAGKMTVDKITDFWEAASVASDTPLWEASYYALPKPENVEPLKYIPLGDAAFDLRFNSSTADRFDWRRGKINPQQLQTMRELTAESARLLTDVWENAAEDVDDDDYNFPDAEDVRIFEEIVEQNPFDAAAHYNLGVVLSQFGEIERAIESYQRAVRLSPNYAEAWYNLGADYLELGAPQKSFECFRKAAEAKPDFAQAYFMAGAACNRLDNHEESIRLTRQGLNYAPEDPLAFYNLGNSYERLNDAQQAAEHFEQAAHLAPDFAEAFFRAGRCRELLGETSRAIEFYRRAVEISPDFIAALLALGVLYHREKYGTSELFEDFPIENSLDLTDARSFFYLGMAFLALGELELAREQVETLREMRSPLADRLERFRRAQ